MEKILLAVILMIAGVFLFSCATIDTFIPEGLGEELKEPENLKAEIDDGNTDPETGKYLIVDVRPTGAYDGGHIPTAINIVNGDTSSIDNPPAKDRFIIVYCETGGRAEAAAKKMMGEGYQYLLNWGGFGRWGNAGYEYETTK